MSRQLVIDASDASDGTEAAAIPPAIPGAGHAIGAELDAADRAHARGLRWRRIRGSLGLGVACTVLAVAFGWALLPGVFARYDPNTPLGGGLQGPSAAHWFGTDQLGRDLLSRVIYGAAASLTGALIAVVLGLVAGTLIGVISGSSGRLVDDVLMRLVDVLLAVPSLLLALTVVILLGPGTANVAIAIGVTSVASFSRLVRAEVVQVRHSEFVEAAYGSGGRRWTVLARHILPNSIRPVYAMAAMRFGGAIIALSTLGFLGYGVQPPKAEWGMLIAQGRNLLGAAWWATTLPGIVILAVVLSTNRISQALGAQR